jgi:hypothetical protein
MSSSRRRRRSSGRSWKSREGSSTSGETLTSSSPGANVIKPFYLFVSDGDSKYDRGKGFFRLVLNLGVKPGAFLERIKLEGIFC